MRTRRGSYPSPSDGITFFIKPKRPLKRRKISPSSSSSSFHRSASDSSSSSSSSSSSCPSQPFSPSGSFFDELHDELLISIMVSLGSSSTGPADLINAMLTCKRFCMAGAHKLVLANVSLSGLAVTARKWSDGSHRFLRQCARAGNAEAAYTLGMIRFYCFKEMDVGISLMAQAAMAPHAPALHSLAIIQFNGSGGTRKEKNLKTGASLCARAAALSHVDAMRELGHCLQDGYGVAKNVSEGRRLLLEANAREAAAAAASSPRSFVETALHLAQSTLERYIHHQMQYRSAIIGKFETVSAMAAGARRQEGEQRRVTEARVGEAVAGGNQSLGSAPVPLRSEALLSIASALTSTSSLSLSLNSLHHPVYRLLQASGGSLLSDFGCNVPPPKLHVANKFLVDWFAEKPPFGGLRLCSHGNCGRPETRRHEFRRCSACGKVNYCSRACQALDWKLRHKLDCRPVADWEEREDAEEDEEIDEDEENGEGYDDDDHHEDIVHHHNQT